MAMSCCISEAGVATTGSVEFNYVYIIQSLPPGEPRSGEQLLRDKIAGLVDELNKDGIVVGAELVDIEDAAALYALLAKILALVRTTGRFPILHLEIHGSSDKKGLVLHSGEFIAWEALIEPLTIINRAMRHNLVLTLAVCSGAYLGTIINAAREAPFWGIVGPDRREWDGELLNGFKAFYGTFLTTLDGAKAIESLRRATAKTGEARFLFVNAEQMFASAFKSYVAKACNPDAVKERVGRIVEEAKTHGLNAPPAKWEEIAATVTAKMTDPRPAFERFRRVFFMIDQYPENDARFPLTFDQAMT
jgi:hypothetical protein